MKAIYLFCILCFIGSGIVKAQKPIALDIRLNSPSNQVPATMWGIFFEDINFAADGGIYAELVKNRSFNFNEPLMGWKSIKSKEGSGELFILNSGDPAVENKRVVRILSNSDSGNFGIQNEGFRGIGLKKGAQYRLTLEAKNLTIGTKLNVSLVDSTQKVVAESKLQILSEKWDQFELLLTSSEEVEKAKLNILVEGKGTVEIRFVSLFPVDTWKGRKNGLRRDLCELLAGLKPGFIRFPGGCIVEGRTLENRYQWKKTVGDIKSRQLIINRWNTEFKHRFTPDYFQSFGLGFYEYFLLAEDLGASPLPIINCGMACQYNSGELVQTSNLDPYVQDALDLIEFANGPVTSTWGKLRADMGHPNPFNLKLLGVGNEQWGSQYIERLRLFEARIRAKYPDIKLVTSAGPSPEGDKFSYLWKELRELSVDFVDEHYYQSPSWFLNNAKRYDSYDRKGPKVFAGEYASHSTGQSDPLSRNNWESALSEAAFMTGLERNCDVVQMCSYAPLFAHRDAWQWNPDLIWFNNLDAIATPNYYVQQIFSTHKGTRTVSVLLNNQVVAGQDSLFASATLNESSKELMVKIVNTASKSKEISLLLPDAKHLSPKVTLTQLQNENRKAWNSFINPTVIKPQEKMVPVSGKGLKVTLPSQSVNVVKFKM